MTLAYGNDAIARFVYKLMRKQGAEHAWRA